MNEYSFLITNIKWDTDNEEIEGLPDTYYIPFSNLLIDNECLDNVDIQELRDRIADYLTDFYGWCIVGFTADYK